MFHSGRERTPHGAPTFSSSPPQQQPQQVPSAISDVSTLEYIALGLVGGIWMGANLVYKGIGSVLNYAASSLGYSGSAAAVKRPKYLKVRNKEHRHDPLGTRSRPRSPAAPKTPRPLKSAMAPKWRNSVAISDNAQFECQLEVLPHNDRETLSHVHSNAMVMDADGDIQMGGMISPIQDPSPQAQAPKANATKRVQFTGMPGAETKDGAVSFPATSTLALVRETPAAADDTFDSREDFRKNFNQTKYKRWIEFLQSQGISVKEYRENLHNELALPTEIILRLYSQREKTPENWKTLVTCLSHNGFMEKMGIAVPKYLYGPPPRRWVPDEPPLKIPYNNPIQQQDGQCCFCRGFEWAGAIETRTIAQYGDEVECRSQHGSATPYTEKELEDFRRGLFDSFWRRCCQESRWDWAFEEPVANEPTELEWKIPQWDARLRHFRQFKNPRTGEAFGGGLYLPQENQLHRFYELQTNLSRQDLAAKLFVDAIEEAGNEELASDLRKMDKERKRTQVQTELLCVRQVRLKVEAEPPAPAHDCDPSEPVVPNSAHVADREEARRSPAEWARFGVFKERYELRYSDMARAHYRSLASGDLDPEEATAKRYEYDQKMWQYFLEEEKCLQEEKEQDERSRMKRDRPPLPPMEIPKSGWDRRKIAKRYGMPPIQVTGEDGALDQHLKQRAAIREGAKEIRRQNELHRAWLDRSAYGGMGRGWGKKDPRFRV